MSAHTASMMRKPLVVAMLVALLAPGMAVAATAKEKELEARVAQLEAQVQALLATQQAQQAQVSEAQANIAEVNALNGNGIVIASDNVSVSPAYVAPAPKQQTVAGYHLDATCALKGLGEPSPQVPVDYDGDPRGDGNASYPEIGPDECK